MVHHNTVFSQMLTLTPRHEFESLAHQYYSGRRLRKTMRWTQFVAMATAQLSGHTCLLLACLLKQAAGSRQEGQYRDHGLGLQQ